MKDNSMPNLTTLKEQRDEKKKELEAIEKEIEAKEKEEVDNCKLKCYLI